MIDVQQKLHVMGIPADDTLISVKVTVDTFL